MAKYGAQDRRDLAKRGHALPDGSFPITDVEDLKSAIRNWALGKQPDVAKRFIIKRARALGAVNVLPTKWLHPEVARHSDNVDDFLAHYGIKGMRWGVVHPPDTSTGLIKSPQQSKEELLKTKRDAKGQKFDEIAAGYDRQIKQLQAQPSRNRFQANARARDIRDLEQYRDRAKADAELKRQGKLSSTQKKIAIGAGVAAAVLLSSAVYTGVQSGEFNRLAIRGKMLASGSKDLPFKKNALFAENKNPTLVHEFVVKGINPNYGSPGTKVNCRRATFAYEMRRRGYDVRATRTTNGFGQNATSLQNALTPGKFKPTNNLSVIGQGLKEAARELKNPESTSELRSILEHHGRNAIPSVDLKGRKIVRPEDILSSLSKQPDGSRGELSVRWLAGSGHSMAYEIFNNKPVIFDAQSGEKIDGIEQITSRIGHVAAAGFTRLDNVDLNTNFISRWVKSA